MQYSCAVTVSKFPIFPIIKHKIKKKVIKRGYLKLDFFLTIGVFSKFEQKMQTST